MEISPHGGTYKQCANKKEKATQIFQNIAEFVDRINYKLAGIRDTQIVVSFNFHFCAI